MQSNCRLHLLCSADGKNSAAQRWPESQITPFQVGWEWGDQALRLLLPGKCIFFKGWEIFCVLFLRIYREKLTLKPSMNRLFPVKCLSLTLISAISASWPQTDISKYSS